LAAPNKNALVIFAKDPVEGKVKTRLQSLLDIPTICQLYTRFLDDTLKIGFSVPRTDLFAGVYPSLDSGYFDKAAVSGKLQLFLQQGENLGDRMQKAFADRFNEGYERVVIIGGDSPTLPKGYIETAFDCDRDVVLGPSTDGGYYLIGMNRRVVDIFEGVNWGTERVLSQTLDRIRERAVTLELLPVWYDVDLPDELRFLKTHLQVMNYSGVEHASSTWEFLSPMNLETPS